MVSGLIRNLSKRSILQQPERRRIVDSGVWTEGPSLTNHQQCRAYARSPPQLYKTSGLGIYLPRHFSSSSSSSSSKIGFLGWYLGMLESRPILTKSVTASIIYTAADLTSQMITLPSSVSFDSIRTLRMAGYGLLILGPTQHVWFNFISKVLPKRDIVTTLKKLLMGQAIYGPCATTVFFSFNAGLQGESGDEIVARLKRDLLPTLINGLLYWPMCDFVTFKFIPVHLQPLINGSFSYLWTIYLTYMACLKKAGAD